MQWLRDIIDIIFAAGLFINALLFVPQATRIFKNKTSENLSLTMFIGFLLTQLAAVLYGFFNNDYVLAFGYMLSMVTCSVVTVLIFIYRKK
ncbi:MAG: hypothetical protein A3C55_00360 [Gammaproteobacteria bacterium RIFCSPHIGHO2_02_FULL_42_13]|nr:MAG: hypothetical protein A3C55_00360 [Gammaproteobacteria bacterium RIFCSPHIGHO2_02_FULL_42_13]OGT68648.1 MAG: hypothetical protein A3H43_00765 [Gammaproteobacteria bacterium RIFCSPLOWO2_02_FULL_42_9]HLB58424.1 PQ-loop repeat-containing protein [Gammaproteobacteria bacterium]